MIEKFKKIKEKNNTSFSLIVGLILIVGAFAMIGSAIASETVMVDGVKIGVPENYTIDDTLSNSGVLVLRYYSDTWVGFEHYEVKNKVTIDTTTTAAEYVGESGGFETKIPYSTITVNGTTFNQYGWHDLKMDSYTYVYDFQKNGKTIGIISSDYVMSNESLSVIANA